MSEAAVQLKVAGKSYQVVTSADPDELHRLAAKVEEALLCVNPQGREPSAQTLVLAAITLAHELEDERALRAASEERHRKMLKSAISKVDRVLQSEAFGGAELPSHKSVSAIGKSMSATRESASAIGEPAPVMVKSVRSAKQKSRSY